MKFLIRIIVIMSIVSCSNDDERETTVTENVNINGTWKPSRYEFKGKSYAVSTCQQKGQMVINTDFSGVYERYEIEGGTGNCIKPESYTGKWNYDKIYSNLTLTYTESGVTKTLQKSIEEFSDNELRILDNSEDLDNVPGNDEAVLVFIKE